MRLNNDEGERVLWQIKTIDEADRESGFIFDQDQHIQREGLKKYTNIDILRMLLIKRGPKY